MAKTGRNDLCPCGSGKKYKKCHEAQDTGGTVRSRLMMIMVGGAMVAAILAALASFTSEPAVGRVWSPEHGHYHDANGQEIP
jgi:hypothetical protein